MRSLERNSKPCAPWVIRASTCENGAVERDSNYLGLRELSFHHLHPLCSRFDVSPMRFYSQFLQPPKYRTWHLLRRSRSQQAFTGIETLAVEKLPTRLIAVSKARAQLVSFPQGFLGLSVPPSHGCPPSGSAVLSG